MVATAAPDESVREAVRRMALHRVGALVVVDDVARPIGILTDRDAALRCVGDGLDPAETRVGDIMTVPVRSVTEATPIEDALAMMVAGPTRRVIVVDPGGRLAGILSVDDVVALLAEEMRVIGRLLERQEPVLPPLVSTDRARSIGSGSAAA